MKKHRQIIPLSVLLEDDCLGDISRYDYYLDGSCCCSPNTKPITLATVSSVKR